MSRESSTSETFTKIANALRNQINSNDLYTLIFPNDEIIQNLFSITSNYTSFTSEQDANGNTLLHIACMTAKFENAINNFQCIGFLGKLNADSEVLNTNGLTAFQEHPGKSNLKIIQNYFDKGKIFPKKVNETIAQAKLLILQLEEGKPVTKDEYPLLHKTTIEQFKSMVKRNEVINDFKLIETLNKNIDQGEILIQATSERAEEIKAISSIVTRMRHQEAALQQQGSWCSIL